MRYIELLEAEDRYIAMFRAMYPDGIPPQLEVQVRGARQRLKRQDRIVWYLKWLRITILISRPLVGHRTGELQLSPDEKADIEMSANFFKKFSGGMSVGDAKKGAAALNITTLSHFVSMSDAIPKLGSIVWDRQSPQELIEEMTEVEQDWKQKQDQEIQYDSIDDLPEVFLQIDSHWAWYDLNKSSCDDESKAMGHCGNGAGSADENILSLRRITGPNRLRPSLTFIHHADGTLGEMKGRENNPPSAKYHDAIAALLRDPRIKGITGGGYKPENNFKMADLPDEIKKDLQEKNPMLRDIAELYYYWQNEMQSSTEGDGALIRKRLIQGVSDSLIEWGYQFKNFDIDRGIILVDDYANPEAYMDDYHSLTKRANDFFDNLLAKQIERRYDIPSNKASNIAQAAKRGVFPHAFSELLPYDVDYVISEDMHPEMTKEGRIIIELPIDDYIEKILDPDAEGYSKPESLEEMDDHRDSELSNIIQDAPDEPTELLYRYLWDCERARESTKNYGTVNWPTPTDDLISAMYEQFKAAQDDSHYDEDGAWREFDFE